MRAFAVMMVTASVSLAQTDEAARQQVIDELYRGACGLSNVPIDVLTSGGAVAPRLEGLGDLHFPITTDSEDAQRFFDQGMVLAYGFNHGEAARSFLQATVLDPECAMAWWGYALVLGPNINMPMDASAVPVAYEAIQKAKSLSSGATQRERDYINALAARYAEEQGEDRSALDQAYADAMGAMVEKYPDDLDARTLYVEAQMDCSPWNYWSADGRPRDWTPAALAVLESVMAQDPDHVGACHLYIHMCEAAQPERAEAAADRLAQTITGAGHLVHMPSHIYVRIGRYDDSVAANKRASKTDEEYITQCRKQGVYPLAYYPHNVHFLWASATMMGDSETALGAANKVADGIGDGVRGPMQQLVIVPWLAMVRFGQWDEMLAVERPHEGMVYANGIWRYARAMALARTGHPDDAQIELDQLMVIRDSADVEGELVFVLGGPASLLKIASEVAAGEIAAAQGDYDTAIARLSRAVRLEDALPYNEPEDWANPTRLNLGAVLLEAGYPAEAEAVFWNDLKKHPDNGWALSGLVAAMRAQGESREAELEAVEERLSEAWSGADITVVSGRF